jgi:hypothetical protein
VPEIDGAAAAPVTAARSTRREAAATAIRVARGGRGIEVARAL